jgi:hypothetical protein
MTIRVPNSLLRGLVGPTGDGQRPLQQKAVPGTRFYDGFAASFADVTTSTQVNGTTSTESYLYQADSAPTFDFLLKAPTVVAVPSRVPNVAPPVVAGGPPAAPAAPALAATGLSDLLPWAGLLLIAGFWLAHRRSARA